MNNKKCRWIGLVLLSTFILAPSTVLLAQPPAMIHYQGRLVDGTNLVNGTVVLYLNLYDAPVGGTLLYSDENVSQAVNDGLYHTMLGDGTVFGTLDQALTNNQVWLEVVVNAVTLTPRERLVAVPYARAVHGLHIRPDRHSVALNPVAGTNTASGTFSVVGGGTANLASGEYSLVGGGRGNRATLWYGTVGGGEENLVNINYGTIGGGRANWVPGDYGTIAGGGNNIVSGGHASVGGGQANVASGLNSTIGGGLNNQIFTGAVASVISGGQNNLVASNAARSVIGGGGENRIEPVDAVIGGGRSNIIYRLAQHAVIGGGQANVITTGMWYSVIGGGLSNRSVGGYSMIPGGRDNMATDYSFAAGRRAHALHSGSFVWADNGSTNFATTFGNQFLARADFYGFGRNYRITGAEVFGIQSPATSDFGGMYINTAGIGGSPFYGYAQGGSATAYHYVNGAQGSWRLNVGGDRITVLTNGFVGIGTTTPTNRLQVAGIVQATAYITTSDRNAKENIQPVSPDEILDKVVDLPIATWTLKEESNGTHIGPMAQDFYAAFGFGNTDTGIMTVDADGVALASIQALAARLVAHQTRIETLEAENARLHERLQALEQKLGL